MLVGRPTEAHSDWSADTKRGVTIGESLRKKCHKSAKMSELVYSRIDSDLIKGHPLKMKKIFLWIFHERSGTAMERMIFGTLGFEGTLSSNSS